MSSTSISSEYVENKYAVQAIKLRLRFYSYFFHTVFINCFIRSERPGLR